MKLSDFTIKARLLALAALAVVAMLVVGLQGLRSVSQARDDFTHYVNNDVESLTQLAGIRAGVGNLRRYEKDLLINLADAQAVARYRTDWNATFDKTAASLERMGRLDLPADLRRMPQELLQALQDYRSGFNGIAERVVKAEFADTAAANQAMEPVKGPVRAVDKALAEMVVAGEVRTLAQRSAEAAKEIKSLITQSGENVDSGAALVTQAGRTMNEIIESIARVSAIVSEISLATGEQSTGIGQIGQAIAGLDQMTQQNASLVEESAAAAASLQQQADALARSVAVFKLG